MKTSFAFAFLLSLITFNFTNAQHFANIQKSPTDITYAVSDRNARPDIKVIYSRPQKKGRTIFGELVPYDKVWRTGADEATEIKFFKDVTLKGTTIKAGTYTLFTIPGQKTWSIIINSDTDVWGAYSYDQTKDIARIEVTPTTAESLEAFSIAFEKATTGYHMVLGWDTTRVSVPFEIQ